MRDRVRRAAGRGDQRVSAPVLGLSPRDLGRASRGASRHEHRDAGRLRHRHVGKHPRIGTLHPWESARESCAAPGVSRRGRYNWPGARCGDAGTTGREQRRTTDLAATRGLAQSVSLAEAAPAILRAICESLDWDFAALWIVDRDGNVLRCVETWYRPSKPVPVFRGRDTAAEFRARSRVTWSRVEQRQAGVDPRRRDGPELSARPDGGGQ